jgi:hypothetical protein
MLPLCGAGGWPDRLLNVEEPGGGTQIAMLGLRPEEENHFGKSVAPLPLSV